MKSITSYKNRFSYSSGESFLHEVLKKTAFYISVVVLVLGILVLLGWQFDIALIKRPIPGLAAMNPLTAINFILLEASFLCIVSKFVKQGYWLALAVVVISFFFLVGLMLDFSFQADLILFSGKIKADASHSLSSRMAPNTAMNFVLGGVVILLMKRRKRAVYICQTLSLLIVLIALFSIFGYIYRVGEFYGVLVYIPMSIHTAICFFMFGVEILFFHSDRGVMKELTSPYAGGMVSRILIPLAIIIPGFLGFIRLYLNWKYSFSVELGTAILVVALIVILVLLIWFEALSLNEKDSKRRQAEDEVRLANMLLESTIESHKDVLIFSVDKNLRYLTFNSAFKDATYKAYGTTIRKGERMIDSITIQEEKERASRNCKKAMKGEGLTSIEVYGEFERNYFETRYYPILNDKNDIVGVTVLASNITERKKNDDEIQTLNKELESFSYSVAHDLRAPLRIIDGYSNILIEDCFDDLSNEGQRLLYIISSNAKKMGQLIDDLLNFSKLGRLPVTKSVINTAKLIRSVLDEQLGGVNRSNIEINLGTLEDLYCDDILMRHVFTNLISNALKYTGKKELAVIEIGSSRTDKSVIYWVKDNGAGFDIQYADKLFGVFQRLHKESDFEGTGVGLAIVHRIISKHDGKIWAEAEIDKGATFYFSLPLMK
ncbi:PAS domain-containing protein [Fulvivirga sp. 29W222]|uniref:histidine kinase n=1 Tax=Fulvivirga marina TaxID=2494733 RepID=A0A937FV18_9BACT|nr:ATP-binding protein [Fulvivirga marina]MBL6445513.1 PAS domain-containing protein [Fulvivirga marina]